MYQPREPTNGVRPARQEVEVKFGLTTEVFMVGRIWGVEFFSGSGHI